MRGEAVPQRMNADPLGDAGTPGCQANDPMQLARTRMLPAVAGKQPGLTGRHPALQTLADRTQYHVAGVVAVIVIVFLEMIDIDRKDADALSGARGSRKFAAAGLQHVAPVEKTGQRAAERQREVRAA